MAQLPERFCVKECIKDGETHTFAGKVKLILVEPPPQEEMWWKIGSAFIAAANIMMGGNLGVMLVFACCLKLPLLSSAHALFCTIATQFILPQSVMILHSLHGPSALMNRDRKRCEHIWLSSMSITLGVISGVLIIFESPNYTRYCMKHIHVYGGYAMLGTSLITAISGILMQRRKEVQESPSIYTWVHRAFGMATVLLSAFTYMASLYGEGECRNTFKLWAHAIGYESPLYLLYFLVIFYTGVILLLPGSKFVIPTTYNCSTTYNVFDFIVNYWPGPASHRVF